RTIPDPQWRLGPQILSSRFKKRTEKKVPRAAGRLEEKLEVLHGRCPGAQLLEGLSGSLRGDDSAHGNKTRALVRHPGGQQVVHAAGGRLGDHRNSGGSRLSLPGCRQSQEEGIGNCPRVTTLAKGLILTRLLSAAKNIGSAGLAANVLNV